MRYRFFIIGVGMLVIQGCAGSYESALRHDFRQARIEHDRRHIGSGSADIEEAQLQSGTMDMAAYIGLALKHNPELYADFERWQASVHRISRARRLPEPVIGFGYFVQSVETRVGAQQARISLQQAFPWPTRLIAGADAASARARAMQRRFEAKALTVLERVNKAYWDLWQVRTSRAIRREHLAVMHSLADSVRGRVATGKSSLADLQQIDLTAAQIEDSIGGMDESERRAEARLAEAIGVVTDLPLSTLEQPGSAIMPVEDLDMLLSLVRSHPEISSTGFLVEASEAQARVERSARFPSFTLGADWIITGEASIAGVENSGKDALIIGAGIRLPLWQGSYSDSVAAAEADSYARRAEQRALTNRAETELTATLAGLRDAVRRVGLYREVLIPQADGVYESTLGAYISGRGDIARILLAQRDLLELKLKLERARADHARMWGQIEELVGQELSARPVR